MSRKRIPRPLPQPPGSTRGRGFGGRGKIPRRWGGWGPRPRPPPRGFLPPPHGPPPLPPLPPPWFHVIACALLRGEHCLCKPPAFSLYDSDPTMRQVGAERLPIGVRA